jgi:hypothetical protein
VNCVESSKILSQLILPTKVSIRNTANLENCDLVDKTSLQNVIRSLFQENSRQSSNDAVPALLKKELNVETHFHVVDAFSMTQWVFDPIKKFYIRSEFIIGIIDRVTEKKSLIAPASSRWKFIKERYDILKQRVLRLDIFSGADAECKVIGVYFSNISSQALLHFWDQWALNMFSVI